jgi:hypothetical protein
VSSARSRSPAVAGLLEALLRLKTTEICSLDYVSSSPSVLLDVAEASEKVAARCSRGLAAIGLLLACAAEEADKQSSLPAALESLGLLLMETGELASYCVNLARCCRAAAQSNDDS